MVETLTNYGMVFLGSMVKFIFGPLAGMARNLSVVETALLTAMGMMATVFIISLMSDEFRHKMVWKFKRDKRLFTRRNRQMVRIWNRWGLKGVAFLTPVIFMPIGGALIALSFGGCRVKMMKYMAASSLFWGFTYAFVFHQVGHAIVHAL